jgi:hypothetical protein
MALAGRQGYFGTSAMTYRGHIKNGVVVLERRVKLAEGTAVRVEPLTKAINGKKAGQAKTLGQRLLKFAGSAKGLPSDMARNHDHYIHGAPRR